MIDNQFLHVAAVQMLPAAGDPRANLERATRLARAAVAQHGAEVIVFPECTLTGYTGERAIAETVPGPSVNHFADLARELRAYIVWGLHEREGDRYFNAAAVLSPDGKLVGRYRKVHINKYEDGMHWTNGDAFFVWPCEVRGIPFNLGVMICYDREVPEAARCLAMLGADLIAIPQATSCTCNIPIHRDQLRVRAYENEVWIAMANWAGPDFKGHSMTIQADGTLIELGGQDEQILAAAFDVKQLRELRRQGIYGRHHRQPKAYGPLLAPLE